MRPEILYRKARIYYEHNQFRKALEKVHAAGETTQCDATHYHRDDFMVCDMP